MTDLADRTRREAPVLTSHADVARVSPEPLGYRMKRALLGRPLVTEQLSGERLSRPIALGVLAPDCISSSAYGAEQILTQLTPAIGLAAFAMVTPIMFVILGVLLFVTTSYLDVIKYYTSAGGSYIVTRDNFGPKVAQIAAVALLIDYIVTVAVQCSAGTAALTSAFPQLAGFTLWITIGVVLVLIYGNLRGIREAGSYFALPTYFYVATLGTTILLGFVKYATGTLPVLSVPADHASLAGGTFGVQGTGILYGLTFITLMRAYANGGASLTGLEAISNGVASFRSPESRNARATLTTMSCVLAFLLAGTALLASWTHAVPFAAGTPTVVSQEVGAVFGTVGFGHVMFLVVQFATVMILYTGGNTSFSGFPFLANYVASDGYLPRQLTRRGHRLAFSNGIVVLGIVALFLIIVSDARLNSLIALYAIGVFTGFTLAGMGMVARHRREKTGRWRLGVAVNALSATVTAVVVIIFLIAKFTEGAWAIAVVGPLMYFALIRLHKQYVREEHDFQSGSDAPASTARINRVVVFVDNYDLVTERALQYCETLNAYSIRAVHFDIDPMVTRELESRWGRLGTTSASIDLEVAECEDRRVERAALEVVADVVRDPGVFCTVVLPRRGFSSRIARLLHDRTADSIAGAVMHVPRASATIVPFRAVRNQLGADELSATCGRDDVLRGGVRETTHLVADLRLAERSAGSTPIGTLAVRQTAQIAGRVRSISASPRPREPEFRCVVADGTGSVTLVFQGRSKVPGIERGTRLLISGTVLNRRREAVMLNPIYEIVAGAPERTSAS